MCSSVRHIRLFFSSIFCVERGQNKEKHDLSLVGRCVCNEVSLNSFSWTIIIFITLTAEVDGKQIEWGMKEKEKERKTEMASPKYRDGGKGAKREWMGALGRNEKDGYR